MAEYIYQSQNFVNPTTASPAKVATGTAIKTLLQVTTTSTQELTIVAWGIDFDGSAAATPISVELIDTGSVAATTGTAVTPTKWSAPNDRAANCTSLHTPSAEGTITATRELDPHLIAPTGQYAWEFSLGREPVVAPSSNLRIRVLAGTTVNAWCWIRWRE